jgi:hypothetical protein
MTTIGSVAVLAWACRTPAPAPEAPPAPPLAVATPAPLPVPEKPAALPPPGVGSSEDDWIRLVSDEMLRGEIIVLRSGTLKFDSDELDDLAFDFEDVVEVYTSRSITGVFGDDTVLTGPVHVHEDVVFIGTGPERRGFPRSELVTLIPGTLREPDYWSGEIGFGLDVRNGNVDQEDLSFDGAVRRRTPFTRTEMSFVAAVTTLDGEDTANNQKGSLKIDYFLSRRVYLTPVWLQYFRDPFQNIAQRWAPGAGAGYYLFDRPDLEWTVDAGAGFLITRFDSTAPGEDDTDSAGFGRVGTFLDADLTKDTDLSFEYALLIPFEESDSNNQGVRLVISTDLWRNLDLDVTFAWARQGDPEPDSDGTTPERNDYRTTVGLSWDF